MIIVLITVIKNSKTMLLTQSVKLKVTRSYSLEFQNSLNFMIDNKGYIRLQLEYNSLRTKMSTVREERRLKRLTVRSYFPSNLRGGWEFEVVLLDQCSGVDQFRFVTRFSVPLTEALQTYTSCRVY